MTLVQLLFHLGNFLLPALAMALFMPLAGRWVMGRSQLAWSRRLLVHCVLGVAVLVMGLIVLGEDGRMLTYLALVVLSATLEWVMHMGWRRST